MTSVLPVTRTRPVGEVTGPPVVLVHGFASSVTADWPVERWADPLALAGRETLVVHLPGHPGGPYVEEVDDVTTWNVLRRLAEGMPSEQVDLVGYSLGARLAWDLTATRAVPVRRLVLGGLSPVEPFGRVDLVAARSIVQGGQSPVDPLTGAIAGMVTRGRAEELLRLVEGLAREPFDPGARAPQAPTLFLAGADDPMAGGVERLVARIPHALLQHVPGDHRSALTGAEFRDAVFQFLGVLSSQS